MLENPYDAPTAQSGVAADDAKNLLTTLTVTEDSLNTLAFTGQLIRSVAVFCGFGAFGYLFSVIMGFYYLGFSGWSWLHTIQAYRLIFFPTMLAIGYFGWKCADGIAAVSKKKTMHVETYISAQGYLWLTIAAHVFVILCGIGLSFSASWAVSGGQL